MAEREHAAHVERILSAQDVCCKGAVLRVQYDGKFAQVTQQNSVSLKGSVPF